MNSFTKNMGIGRLLLWGSFFLGSCLLKVQATEGEIRDWELIFALQDDDRKCTRCLLEQGADANRDLGLSLLPLSMIARDGSIGTMRLLLDYGADPNLPSDKGEMALHMAASCGFVKKTELLLDSGADPNVKDMYDRTPLMWLVHMILFRTNEKPRSFPRNINCYFATMKALVDRGADVNVKDNEGNTALHEAVKSCRLPVYGRKRLKPHLNLLHLSLRLIKELIELGADVNLENNNGDTPLDILLRRKEELPSNEWIFRSKENKNKLKKLKEECDQAIALLREHGAMAKDDRE